MAIKTISKLFSTILILLGALPLFSQQLVVVNGGIFGSPTDKTNIGIYNSQNGAFNPLDTIGVNSAQDVLIEENRFIYLAAQDSLIKYDLWTGARLATSNFGAPSTIRMGLYQDKLLVGNWYAASEGNLRIFDKNTLTFLDSIPEITKGATDFVLINDRAYIAQNNINDMWADTLGYLAVVDLNTNSFLYNDTLSTQGHEIGRLVNVGDSMIYSLNGVSNTISSLNLINNNKQTVSAAAPLNPKMTGSSVFYDGTKWYLPFSNSIGTYDLVNNIVLNQNLISVPGQFTYAFAVDASAGKIYTSLYDFANQTTNRGVVYNLSGDSTDVFPVGFSPEVLTVLNSSVGLSNSYTDHEDFNNVKIYPNPSSFNLNIVSSATIKNIKIIDLKGVIVFDSFFEDIHAHQLNIASLPNGNYFLVINNKTQIFTKF